MRKLLGVVLLLATFACAKTKPEEFTNTAKVVAVASHTETTRYANVGRIAKPHNETIYVMMTEIGDRVYELQGRRLELGSYKVKPIADGFEFLLTDKNGKATSHSFKIVGERTKEQQQP